MGVLIAIDLPPNILSQVCMSRLLSGVNMSPPQGSHFWAVEAKLPVPSGIISPLHNSFISQIKSLEVPVRHFYVVAGNFLLL